MTTDTKFRAGLSLSVYSSHRTQHKMDGNQGTGSRLQLVQSRCQGGHLHWVITQIPEQGSGRPYSLSSLRSHIVL